MTQLCMTRRDELTVKVAQLQLLHTSTVFQNCDEFLPTMTAAELDSFVTKFKNLWQAGLDAHLDAGSRAGQAWVSLRVGLGLHPARRDHHRQKYGPSRQRRRARREAARQVASGVGGHENDPHAKGEHVVEEATASTTPTEDVANISSAENAEHVKIVVANEVIDEIDNSELEISEEELVIVFGEHSSQDPFDHEQFFGAIKKQLESAVSYFHYDGTYWKENEKENTTGFYQTVRLKPGFYRKYLYNLENWPGGTKITEIRKQDEAYINPWQK